MDVIILITWYFLTVLGPEDLGWFFAVAAVFFMLQALWDQLLLDTDIRTLLMGAQVQLTIAFLLFAVVYTANLAPKELALGVAGAVFLARKVPVWHRLFQESPSAL